jgi:glycosyltransferase involved in cell wall biosynthesis
MKIVQFVNNLEMGGLERLALELAFCQKNAGHEPLIYCLTHRGHLADEAESAGIRVTTFEKPGGPSVTTARSIISALKRDRPDVLHTHNRLVHHYGVVAGRLAGIPLIVNTMHGGEFQISEQGAQFVATTKSPDRKGDLLYRATVPWTDAVVAISEATRQFLIKHRHLSAHKTHVILNGAPLDRFANCPASPGAALPRVRFGTASRFVPDKDHFTLLRAFAQVAKSFTHAELHVAGDGPLRIRIESLAEELGLKERVILHGPIRDMPKFLGQLDIFVMSSLNEGLPIVILEAMAAGLPIVSTRAGGIDEAAIEGVNARFVEPGDVSGLAHEMTRMAECPNLAEIGAHGRDIVSKRFQIEQTWREYERLFDRLKAEIHSPRWEHARDLSR